MKLLRFASVALLGTALAACSTVPAQRADRRIAITIDDLPVHGPIPKGMTALDINREMIRALQRGGAKGATGFVNARWTETEPQTRAALEEWSKAGIALGNHGWSHQNLNDLSAEAYKEEILRNEPLLMQLSGAKDWHWYRYPFLSEGTGAKRAEIRGFLAERGYKIAGVTMSFSDWQFTAPYARCKDSGDAAAVAEIERMYLDSVRAQLGYSRAILNGAYGREVPIVLLMHVGAISARMMPEVLRIYRSEGYRFVSLAEAQSDAAYASDTDPRLEPRTETDAAKAARAGVTPAAAPDYQARLDAMCTSPSR